MRTKNSKNVRRKRDFMYNSFESTAFFLSSPESIYDSVTNMYKSNVKPVLNDTDDFNTFDDIIVGVTTVSVVIVGLFATIAIANNKTTVKKQV